MNFYISDLHFGHKNCMSYDNREFRNIEEHDDHIIKRWNETVGVDDDVYLLGDISWHNVTKTIEIFEQLNGTIHLIVGNHDKKLIKNRDLQKRFSEIVPYKELEFDNGSGVVLCHYPIPCFNHHYYGWYHLYGHVHNSFEENMMRQIKFQMVELYGNPCNMWNVGCMLPYMNYTPRTLREIMVLGYELEKNGE